MPFCRFPSPSPCQKINHRFGVERMSVHVTQQRITGWYCRVISPGLVQAGDTISLLERQTERFSFDQFWQVQLPHRPSIDDLMERTAIAGLAPGLETTSGRMGDMASKADRVI